MSQIQSYGRVDKFLHWWVVLNLGATLVAARGMAGLSPPERMVEYGDHGLSVTTLFIVMIFRFVWRLKHSFPPLPDTMKPWEKLAAKAVHWGLYGLIFAQIGIGVLLASTTDIDFVPTLYGTNYTAFDLVPDSLHDLLLNLHNVVYWAIIATIAIHVIAALKHAIVDRDGVLSGMLPFVGRQNP